MSVKVFHISEFFETWASFSTQAEYDNSGLLIGSQNSTLTGVLTCLDVTQEVINEAISYKCNLIVAHHPIIFRKINSISQDSEQGAMIYSLIRNGISVLAVHTNLDAAQNGVSFVLAEKIGLHDIRILSFHDDEKTYGYGAVGNLDAPLNQDDFLDVVCNQLGTGSIRFAGNRDTIQRVAVCGGTGISLIAEAAKANADAFVTADIKYHEYFDYPDMLKVDAGHYETEFHIASHLQKLLSDNFDGLPVRTTQMVTNPMKVHVAKSISIQKQS